LENITFICTSFRNRDVENLSFVFQKCFGMKRNKKECCKFMLEKKKIEKIK
jgi:hypothetical protein